MYEKIEKIRELKEKGVLTDLEFKIEKRKILNEGNPSPQQSTPTQNLVRREVVNNVKVQSGSGIAGFVISIVANAFYLQPITVIIYAGIGLVFSINGLTQPKEKYNRGLATAGLIISVLTILGGLVLSWLYSNNEFQNFVPAINKYH